MIINQVDILTIISMSIGLKDPINFRFIDPINIGPNTTQLSCLSIIDHKAKSFFIPKLNIDISILGLTPHNPLSLSVVERKAKSSWTNYLSAMSPSRGYPCAFYETYQCAYINIYRLKYLFGPNFRQVLSNKS